MNFNDWNELQRCVSLICCRIEHVVNQSHFIMCVWEVWSRDLGSICGHSCGAEGTTGAAGWSPGAWELPSATAAAVAQAAAVGPPLVPVGAGSFACSCPAVEPALAGLLCRGSCCCNPGFLPRNVVDVARTIGRDAGGVQIQLKVCVQCRIC